MLHDFVDGFGVWLVSGQVKMEDIALYNIVEGQVQGLGFHHTIDKCQPEHNFTARMYRAGKRHVINKSVFLKQKEMCKYLLHS